MPPPPPSLPSRAGVSLLDDRSFRRQLRRATATLLIALLVPIGVLLGFVQVLLNSAQWVDHTDRVLTEANTVEKLLETMQSAFRGYRLVRSPDILATYRQAHDEIDPHLQRLADLLVDNPSQVASLRQLEARKSTWVKMADATLARIAAGASDEEQQASMRTVRGGFNDAIDRAHALIAEEEQLRARRERTLARLVLAMKVLFAAAALVGVITLFWWLRRFLQHVSSHYEASLAAAAKASRAKDDFLAALSHELRTPLTPVLMAASSLREDLRLPADARSQLGMMERNIALEARLIDDLLDLTAISRGKLQLRLQPCDAHTLIGLAVEIVREDARAKAITIQCELAAARSGLVADPARFQQVIWNLLRNAVKFTAAGGRIDVRTADQTRPDGGSELRIEISDTGIGIESERLEQIFEPFDQGGLVGNHRFGGVGLGLTIARTVVEGHGGRIHAESAGRNCGATLVAEFPSTAAAPASAPPADPAAPAAGASARSLRLLLVEDHAHTLQALSILLRRDGHTVVGAANVAEALAIAAVHRFDLVISDLGLPDGTGIQLMTRLRDTYGLSGIALSGYGTKEDIAQSQAAGFIAHLVKPVPFADIRRTLAALKA